MLGDLVGEYDTVSYRGATIVLPVETTVFAYYKPVGIVCTEDRREPNNLLDALKLPKRVTYLGRLDKDSEGLLLLSDDGDLHHALMQGNHGHEKEYEVQIDREVTAEFVRAMEQGVYLPELDRTTRPCKLQKTGYDTFSLILTQGLNRQIRRMCEALGCRVLSLKRVRILNITLGNLHPGEHRLLFKGEERALRRAVGMLQEK